MIDVDIIIPALNEAGNIRRLIGETPDLTAQGIALRVIVVDNGSTDDTAAEAVAAGAQVVREARRGYGYACAAGVAVASAELVVFMDGDGSFDPAELPLLLMPLIENRADLVTGSRARHTEAGAMPPH